MNTSARQVDCDETTPVLIIGGGLIGLSTSLFLARVGVASLLIERHPGTAIHPRAMGFSPRTMEMFQAVGVEEAIRGVEPPLPQGGNIPLVESLVGQEFDCLQEDIRSIFEGPVPGSAIAQDLLEPILRARAEQLGGDLRFSTELVAFEQDRTGVTTTIRDRTSGHTRTVRSQFLVAADGSQSKVRQMLGIGQHGIGSMGHFISMIFEADIMELFTKRHAVMCFFSNETVSTGALVPYPGSAARSDLFRMDVGYNEGEETLADYPAERCIQLIRAGVGIPDLAVRFKTALLWEMNALVADRFQQGRVLLVGDAARTQPPSGGLGGNTGIAEAQNLTWKLAAVLHGEAGEALLTTYDTERRLVADYTAEQVTLLSQQRRTEGSAGITVDPVVINTGYRYSAGDIVQEEGQETLPLAQSPDQWRGEPGTYAAHLILERQGQSISTLDLFGSHFVLLAGSDGQVWKTAAHHLAENLHLSLESYQIDGEAGDLSDVEHRFGSAYGIATTGAVLVRPDGFIAWRSRSSASTEQEAERLLSRVLSMLLFR